MQKKFNYRAELLRNKKVGEDELVDQLLAFPSDEQFQSIQEIYNSKLRKPYLEAALLTDSSYDDISEVLEIESSVIELYSQIYFDIWGWSQLEKLELLDETKDDEKVLKMWALAQGLDFIKWRLGKKVSLSPVDGLQELFSTCVYKAKEAVFNSNVSDASKESAKWVKLSIDIARLLKVWTVDSAAAKQDLAIALKSVVPDFESLEDLINGGS